MSKTPILFIHGWGGSRKSLEKLAKEVEKQGFPVHLLEIPGHGSSPQMGRPWSMLDFANWLKVEKDKLGLEKYSLVGHSFGGKTILKAVSEAILYPEKIVLIDISGIKPKNSLKKTFWKLASKLTSPVFKSPFTSKLRYLIYRFVVGETDYAKTSNNMRESFKLLNEEHFDHELKNIKIDTLVVWGKNDQATPLWMGKQIARDIPNAKLEVLEGTHGLPLKNPIKVSKIITKFLND